MKGQLEVGTVLASGNNRYTVKSLLGAGGQGEVYQVEDSGGKQFALKWYFQKKGGRDGQISQNAQKKILRDLVSRGEPSPCFLWPLDFIEDGKTFGYIMPLRPKNYVSLVELVKRNVEPTFETVCKAAFNLAQGYFRLHSSGYSYRDISFSNVFFDPDTGEILICDNDNVSPDGDDSCQVFGTPRFMAPEIVRGKARPSRETDYYSLAVLLFYLFMVHHPLDGLKEYRIHCMDDKAMARLYGTEPVFIFDPEDDSNRPVRGVHDNVLIYWPLYPEYLQNTFMTAFTEGIRNPQKRITEGVWMDTISNLLGAIVHCPGCGAENFVDPLSNRKKVTCWGCRREIPNPPVLLANHQFTAMTAGRTLVSHQLHRDGDIKRVVGRVVQRPDHPEQIGIRNETEENWTYIRPDQTQTLIPGGKSARVAPGVRINFDHGIVGEIR